MKRAKPITIYPDSDLRAQLDEEAVKQDRSLNNLIINLLRRIFSAKKAQAENGE